MQPLIGINWMVMLWGGVIVVFQLLLTVVISMGAFYFKQLKRTIDEYKALVEKRFGEGDARFDKIEENLATFKGEVYKSFVYKDDFIRILGSFESKFKETMEMMEKCVATIKQKVDMKK